jgi:hypothetical protein
MLAIDPIALLMSEVFASNVGGIASVKARQDPQVVIRDLIRNPGLL